MFLDILFIKRYSLGALYRDFNVQIIERFQCTGNITPVGSHVVKFAQYPILMKSFLAIKNKL